VPSRIISSSVKNKKSISLPAVSSHGLGSHWAGDVGAFIAGLLLPLAFAPVGFFPLAFVSLSVLFWLWQSTPTGKRVFWRGYLFGLGYFGLGVSWVSVSMVRFGGMTLPLSIFLTALLVCFLALYIGIVGYIARRIFFKASSLVQLVLVLPALWVLAEWVRSWLFTGFPWVNIGYSQLDSPLAGLAPVAGVYAVSWATAVSAGIIVFSLHASTHIRVKSMVALLLFWLLSWLPMQIQWAEPEGPTLTASLLQGNIPQEVKWLPEQRQPTIALFTRLTRQNWASDIVIWPETALPAYFHQAEDFLKRFGEEAKRHNTSLLIGIPYMEQDAENRYYNSAVVLNNGETEIYHKYHLVPFGEFIPFKDLLGDLLSFWDIPMSNFSRSDVHQPVVRMGSSKAAVSICYEDVFGEEVIDGLPDANFLINISNDAWFGDSLAPHQHLQKAQMRSLETARPMLRATNNGVSAVINHFGEVVSRSPQFEEAVLTSDFQPMKGATLYVLVGNGLILGWVAILLIFSWYIMRRNIPAAIKV